MIKIIKGLVLLLGLVLIASCSSNNDVVSHRLVQKRKHTNGFYFAGFKSQIRNSQKLTDQHSTNVSDDFLVDFEYEKKEVISADSISIESITELVSEKENGSGVFKPEFVLSNTPITPVLEPAVTRHKLILKSRTVYPQSNEEGSVSSAAMISFFAAIIGWVLLIGIIPAAILNLWLVALGFIVVSLILEAVAYFLSDGEQNVKSAEIANMISGYYWYFMGTMLTVSLGSILFYL